MTRIWSKEISLEKLNSLSKGNMLEHLAIEFTDFGDDYIEAIIAHSFGNSKGNLMVAVIL